MLSDLDATRLALGNPVSCLSKSPDDDEFQLPKHQPSWTIWRKEYRHKSPMKQATTDSNCGVFKVTTIILFL